MSASHHAWTAAGRPPHGYRETEQDTHCCTCASPIIRGVPVDEVETSTMGNHADYFAYATRHVCPACAWLFGIGKGRPGNYIAAGDRYEEAVISLESVVESKRPWLAILRDLQGAPPEMPLCGVMTTDVKPRLWPRTRMATRARFGLYIHAPDYDASGYIAFDLDDALTIIETMLPVLRAGYAKASLYHGLLRDYARAEADPAQALAWETQLAPLRRSPAYLPALIAAGVTQEEKSDVKTLRSDRVPKSAAKTGHPSPPAQLELF